jgi:MFS superfamily sulfate permease-like transporter
MLAGIGIILIIKQIPYAFGVNETKELENISLLSMTGMQY